MDPNIQQKVIAEAFGLNVGFEHFHNVLPPTRLAVEDRILRNMKGSDPLTLSLEETLDILASHAVAKMLFDHPHGCLITGSRPKTDDSTSKVVVSSNKSLCDLVFIACVDDLAW